jgi:hypothetical protein
MAVWQATIAICASGRTFCPELQTCSWTHIYVLRHVIVCLFVCLDLSWPCHNPPKRCGPLLCFWPQWGDLHICCLTIFRQMKQKLLNLEWFLSLKINEVLI